MMFSETFNALSSEGHFTKELLGAGATQIRKANYAAKGNYFQAFSSLSIGLERIGKLCLLLDYLVVNAGSFPDDNFFRKYGHDLRKLYSKSQKIKNSRGLEFSFLQDLDDPIRQNILDILSDFSTGDRYSNLNQLTSGSLQKSPIANWYRLVDLKIYEKHVTQVKKNKIASNAALFAELMGSNSMVLHLSEEGQTISSLEESSRRTGVFEAVAPYRQLYTVQIIRYWAELLIDLTYEALSVSSDIPHYGEVFGYFLNANSYIRTRRTWDRLR